MLSENLQQHDSGDHLPERGQQLLSIFARIIALQRDAHVRTIIPRHERHFDAVVVIEPLL